MKCCRECAKELPDPARFCSCCGTSQITKQGTDRQAMTSLELLNFIDFITSKSNLNISAEKIEFIFDKLSYINLYNKFFVLNQNVKFLLDKFYMSRSSEYLLNSLPYYANRDFEEFRLAAWEIYLQQLKITSMSEILDCCNQLDQELQSLDSKSYIYFFYRRFLKINDYFKNIIVALDNMKNWQYENKIFFDVFKNNEELIKNYFLTNLNNCENQYNSTHESIKENISLLYCSNNILPFFCALYNYKNNL